MQRPNVVAEQLRAEGITIEDYDEVVQAARKRRLKLFRERGIEVLIKEEEKLIAYGELVMKEMIKKPK